MVFLPRARLAHLHYQSLPAILAGGLRTLAGPNAAFRWTLYVLYSAWPISVYLVARLFGLGRWPPPRRPR